MIREISDREDTQSTSTAASSTKRVDFTVRREEPGDYAVKVDGFEGNFTPTVPPAPPETPVTERSPPQPEPPSQPPTELPSQLKEGVGLVHHRSAILGIAVLLAILLPI